MARSNKAARARKGDPLSPRELEILAMLADGDSSRQIAARLDISANTVKTHLTSIYKKIGAQNRVQAARYHLDQRPGSGDPPGR